MGGGGVGEWPVTSDPGKGQGASCQAWPARVRVTYSQRGMMDHADNTYGMCFDRCHTSTPLHCTCVTCARAVWVVWVTRSCRETGVGAGGGGPGKPRGVRARLTRTCRTYTGIACWAVRTEYGSVGRTCPTRPTLHCTPVTCARAVGIVWVTGVVCASCSCKGSWTW